MKTVSFANQKGGVGKSLTTTVVAQALSQNYKKKIVIIDSDPQQSLIELRQLQKFEGKEHFNYPIVSCKIADIENILKQYKDMDYVFIDMPGKLYEIDTNLDNVMEFLWLVDYIFIPIQAGKTEIMSSIEYYKNLLTVKQIKIESKRDLNLKFFINQYQNNNEYKNLKFILEAGNYPVMKNYLRKSLEYERSLLSDTSLLSTSKSTIYNELTYFIDEFLELLK